MICFKWSSAPARTIAHNYRAQLNLIGRFYRTCKHFPTCLPFKVLKSEMSAPQRRRLSSWHVTQLQACVLRGLPWHM